MTEPPAPSVPPSSVPPSSAPAGAPFLPPGTPAGRPRIWQAALLFIAFGGIAGGACAAFASRTNGPVTDALMFLFLASVPLAAGAFALLVFRLWRRRVAEAWPSVAQALLMSVAGVALAIGGCGGWAMTGVTDALFPLAMGLGALFVAGIGLALGAGELFAIALGRLIFGRPVAR